MLLLAAACWLFRVLFIVLVPADRLPPRVKRSLGHLAPAVLAALVAVEAEAAVHSAEAGIIAWVLVSIAVMFVVARRTHSLARTIAVGIVAVLLLDLLVLR